MAEQDQNRSERATPFKLEEAKKRGQVAKSLDFNTLVAVIGLLMAMAFLADGYWAELCALSIHLFASSGVLQFSGETTTALMNDIGLAAFAIIVPFMVTGVIAAIASNLVQTGFIFSADPIKPKFERLNPVAGFKRVFNKRMLFEAFKSVVKLLFFTAITCVFFITLVPGLVALSNADAGGQAGWLGASALGLMFRLGLGLAVVGIIDIAFTRWQFARQMMMSQREVKEEVKRREGDPQIRAKIRELQRENLKQARSMGRLPDADVLITNPSHFGVALRYDRQSMSAPIVLAKGSDRWVTEMKVIARRHGVPILERRSLARLLFKRGVVDHVIPAQAFVEVARVYAELDQTPRGVGRYEVAT